MDFGLYGTVIGGISDHDVMQIMTDQWHAIVRDQNGTSEPFHKEAGESLVCNSEFIGYVCPSRDITHTHANLVCVSPCGSHTSFILRREP